MFDFIKFYLILLNFNKKIKKFSDGKFKIKKIFKIIFFKLKKFQERHVRLPIKKFVVKKNSKDLHTILRYLIFT